LDAGESGATNGCRVRWPAGLEEGWTQTTRSADARVHFGARGGRREVARGAARPGTDRKSPVGGQGLSRTSGFGSAVQTNGRMWGPSATRVARQGLAPVRWFPDLGPVPVTTRGGVDAPRGRTDVGSCSLCGGGHVRGGRASGRWRWAPRCTSSSRKLHGDGLPRETSHRRTHDARDTTSVSCLPPLRGTDARRTTGGRDAPGHGSPGEHRAPPHRQRRRDATDSPAEQGLEAAVPDAGCATARGQGLAVTRARLPREGKALEGEALVRRPRKASRARGARGGRNPVNPMVGSGMQQAHGPQGGATRHGGENPRRRNAFDAWQRRTEASPGSREWTPWVMSTEGRSLKNPVEGARLRAGRREMRLRSRSTQDEDGHIRPRSNVRRLEGWRPRTRGTHRDTRTSSGKGQRPGTTRR
jgi:hypothetical protein